MQLQITRSRLAGAACTAPLQPLRPASRPGKLYKPSALPTWAPQPLPERQHCQPQAPSQLLHITGPAACCCSRADQGNPV